MEKQKKSAVEIAIVGAIIALLIEVASIASFNWGYKMASTTEVAVVEASASVDVPQVRMISGTRFTPEER